MENLKNMRVTHVIDHHRLGDLTTSEPIYIRFEPVGSTATILTKLYRENRVHITRKIALLLVSAIISDTVHLQYEKFEDFLLIKNITFISLQIIDYNKR